VVWGKRRETYPSLVRMAGVRREGVLEPWRGELAEVLREEGLDVACSCYGLLDLRR
jgi:hypothetical protein